MRQLRLSLSPDTARYQAERDAEGMPPKAKPRPGLAQITEAGETWQAEKLDELRAAFGADRVVGATRVVEGKTHYDAASLSTLLSRAEAPCFVVEGEFAVGATFVDAMGARGLCEAHGLDFASLRPDLIELVPAGSFAHCIDARGALLSLDAGDPRVALRVIDIKLTAEANAGYFTEVCLYAMALAGWLEDAGLAGRFVVTPDPALWPGAHEASQLSRERARLAREGAAPTWALLRAALEGDLEVCPFEAFAYRLRRFFADELPRALAMPWRDLPWHVDNRCRHCDWLGYPWRGEDAVGTSDPEHCYPAATFGSHLSRVAFLSRGARAALQAAGVDDLEALAQRAPDDTIFDAHHLLRTTRAVLAGRARALETGVAEVPPGVGTSAVLPRWADLSVFVTADFDPGSAVTLAFGIRARHVAHRAWGDPDPTPRAVKDHGPEVFLVDQKELAVERRELLGLLDRLRALMDEARSDHADTTFQVYLWDSITWKHLCRVVGRHLDAILAERSLGHLAWLFPPESVARDHASASRRSPVSVVKDAVRAVLAAPTPHFYSLLGVARSYHPAELAPSVARFHLHPLFEDPLSDQIPPERAHEIWTRSSARGPWLQQAAILQETVSRRLTALEAVTERLSHDLRPHLADTAPVVRVGPPRPIERLPPDSQLWYAHARLGEALAELEVFHLRAMPAAEREARFKSARLPRRLTGAALDEALATFGLAATPERRVYALSPGSTQVSLKEGDFQLALSPEAMPGVLDRNLARFLQGALPEAPTLDLWKRSTVADLCGVTLVAIDRDRGLVGLDLSPRWRELVERVEARGGLDLSHDVVLDPTHRAFFSPKLRKVLDAIAWPERAERSPQVLRAMGQPEPTRRRFSRDSAAAEFLWSPGAMHAAAATRDLPQVRAALEADGVSLNASQWRAWTEALSRRLALVWGPPGTGKSATLRAILRGALIDARARGVGLRVLVTAPTYDAFDNVLEPALHGLRRALAGDVLMIRRLRSASKEPPRPELLPFDLVVARGATNALCARLDAREGLTLVAATAEQVSRLASLDDEGEVRPWFDLVLVDEASQMDVAHAAVALSCLAPGGAVVVAGDPRQLPPIHPAEPPAGLESMVGSIYAYLADRHGVPAVMLEENYRSNAGIVGFIRRAGYGAALRAWSPDLSLSLLSPVPTERPADWPAALPWCEAWSRLLDPTHPTVCFVHPDEQSSQWNSFEADAVAALLRLLYGRLAHGLHGERNSLTGASKAGGAKAYDAQNFWRKGVGVVTPHRAQQGLIVRRLRSVFAQEEAPPERVRAAVDTVERFQGQQRDVIVASFALGDPDLVGDEEEFLLRMERFNVMVSRARAKVIVLVSEAVVRHLAEDLSVLRGSQLLKGFVEGWCDAAETVYLARMEGGTTVPVPGVLRWHRGPEAGG